VAIVVAADHGGFDLKTIICNNLKADGYEVVDVGCSSTESVDYPDFAEKAIAQIVQGHCESGILICGTGIGMSIVANRHMEIRAANCCDPYMAKMSREHNNANVLCLGARVLSRETAIQIVTTWLHTDFAGGRHQRRIEKFSK
jgi:ribose 5-phosphate isomerase B